MPATNTAPPHIMPCCTERRTAGRITSSTNTVGPSDASACRCSATKLRAPAAVTRSWTTANTTTAARQLNSTQRRTAQLYGSGSSFGARYGRAGGTLRATKGSTGGHNVLSAGRRPAQLSARAAQDRHRGNTYCAGGEFSPGDAHGAERTRNYRRACLLLPDLRSPLVYVCPATAGEEATHEYS